VKRKVGVAAGFTEDVQFVVDATPATVRPGVVQGLVALHKPVGQLAAVAVPSQQAVPMGEQLLVIRVQPAQFLGRLAVVVQVDLDLAESLTAKPGKVVEMLGLILLKGVEKRVPRRPAVAVVQIAEKAWVVADPLPDTRPGDIRGGCLSARLEVVRYAQEQVNRLTLALTVAG
jgi:hypothetical protein